MAEIGVPFLDIGATYVELQQELDAAYQRVMSSGWFLLGRELESFEQRFAEFSGASCAIGVASGLDAIVLGLRALGVEPGDEVIVPSNTYIATWLAVSQVGAVPIPVEPDPSTHVIGAEDISARITSRTRVIIPVHLYGLPADMAPIMDLARSSGVKVLCDAAQAHGASYRGSPMGALGDVVAWSFYPGKNLGAYADGGAITTDDPDIAARIRRMRNYGSDVKYVHVEQGVNSRLDELQSAFLSVKLGRLADWNQRRATVAATYLSTLAGLDLDLPVIPADRDSAWHLFVIRSRERDRLQTHLSERGVQTLIHYPTPPHRQGAYSSDQVSASHLPVADTLSGEVLSLPIGPHVADAHVEQVVSGLVSFWS